MVNLDRLDLNLLRVFDAVLEERNLLRAGRRLHLSQSAISHALARLRDSLGEDLFVRTGRGMAPTAYAFEISGPLRGALRSISSALSIGPFDPARASRSLVVAANDYVCATFIPRFNKLLSSAAPGINLVIRPSTRLDLAEQIDLRRIDVAVGMFGSVPARFRSERLLEHDDVLLVASRHPAARKKIGLAELAKYSLAVVSLGGSEDGAVSGFILERGLARQSEMYDREALERAYSGKRARPRIQMTIPHFLAMPMLLEEGTLVAIVPRPLAKRVCEKQRGGSERTSLPRETTLPAVRLAFSQRRRPGPPLAEGQPGGKHIQPAHRIAAIPAECRPLSPAGATAPGPRG